MRLLPWAASILENRPGGRHLDLYTVSQRTCGGMLKRPLVDVSLCVFATVNRHTESERAEAGSLAAWLADHSRVAGVIKDKRVVQ